MIRINTDRILLSILIVSCIVNGFVYEGVFFVTIILLVFRNHKYISGNPEYKWFIIIFAYIILLLINMIHFKTAIGWRPVGTTKVLCAISICAIFSDRICKNELDDIFIKFLILFNFLYVVFGLPNESNCSFIRMIDYPGQNTLGAVNIITIPHIIKTYKNKMRGIRVTYMLSFLAFFIKNLGFTTKFCTAIIFLWFLIDFLRDRIRIKGRRWRIANRAHTFVPLIIAIVVLLFFVNSTFQNTYLNVLEMTDVDRFTILSQALYRIRSAPIQSLIWGSGDSNYYMLTGRYLSAHNFIVEVITFDGLIGLGVLAFETFVFARFMLKKVEDTDVKQTVIISLAMGYIFFMLHPVYTTSFLVKIFLVIVNLRACNVDRENALKM